MVKTVEETYQKKTPLEHILLRPDTYIGSVEKEIQSMYVFDESTKKIISKNISFVPGLYKIFDEILVNAADNKIRDPTMKTIKVDINPIENTISVFNDGKGVPIRIHSKEKVYVPELIFGQLLTSSNYDDKEKKVTGGRNGYGAKLCNIFSTEFIVETADQEVGKIYKQVYKNNMSVTGKPEIKAYNKKADFTRITFKPDLNRFKMDNLDEDIVSLLKKRVYDLSGIVKKVKVYLNDEKLEIKDFEDYVKLYLDEDSKIVHSKINDRWELAFTTSDEQFQQVSFVNSISTSKGGSHVNHVVEQITEPIIELLKKKNIKNVKPFQVKSSMFLFVNSLIENPAFDSQTKENLTLRVGAFGKKCEPLKDFIEKIIKNTEIVTKIERFVRAKEEAELKKKDGKKKKRVALEKLDDAKWAGTAKSDECTLYLTEGESAKTMVMSGRSLVGTEKLGVFPLRGKPLNVREAANAQIIKNEEINAIKQILGLQHKKEYTDTKSLRYGHVMIMADQDHDGSHIKGLLINFFDHSYPSLLKIPGFLQEFITPIIKGRNKRGDVVDFFTLKEYNEFKDLHSDYTYKYYKGLGTSTPKDALGYFSDLPKHIKNFAPATDEDRELIDLAFSKKKADNRKTWLLGLERDTFLDQRPSVISISDFINKELILFSMADNIRSIPSVIDGFKPGQRKILFTCFKRNVVSEVKVVALTGNVMSDSAYNHGEASINSTIIGLAQDFVGSNNINFLIPEGQFGSRLKGGKDHAACRYIFTYLNPLTRLIFHKSDDLILKYLDEENKIIEPEWYVPIIPTVLVNGADGIGTGWSTNIPNFNPLDILNNIRKLLKDEPMVEMIPYYKNFIGSITKISPGKYQVDGNWDDQNDEFLITELPIGTWTENYKIFLESLRDSDAIDEYDDCNTDKTINIKVRFNKKPKNMRLSTIISTNNMICFDQNSKIKKYDTPEEIIKEFYYVRLTFYLKRKEKLLEVLKENMLKNENKVRFIRLVVNDELIINKRKRAEIKENLENLNFLPFDNFNYLLSMEICSLTEERIDKLNKEYLESKNEYETLLKKTPKDLWNEDLDKFEEAYNLALEEEEEEYENLRKGTKTTKLRKKKKSKNVKITEKKTTTTKVTSSKKTIKRSVVNEKSVATKKAKISKEPKTKEKKIVEKNILEISSPVRKSIILEETDSTEKHSNVWDKY
ncbi:DNA topoisomerase 2 (TOP2) [Vairimorpha necatrix]|uniref:DNA topoisomerase 2 n=1 Tax=Vairimorpha necatrix TaxID=6039 RepID=A0AAX4J8W3_9MICR